MAKLVNRLSEKQVRNAKPPRDGYIARLADGGSLYLQVTRSLTDPDRINRCWIIRYQRDHERHEIGIGSALDVSLATARRKAKEIRERLIADGIDPLEERNQAKAQRQKQRQAEAAAQAKLVTFGKAAEDCIRVRERDWKNVRHAKQWRTSLEQYVLPSIGDMAVADVEKAHLVKVLEPLYERVPVTGERVRNRIELILDYATARDFRPKGDNPARWRGNLSVLLGGAAKKAKAHHPAISYELVPAFMTELAKLEAVEARAIEFVILTAARTEEVLGATWGEIDLKAAIWTVPESRMKAGREHRVPLAPRAVEILKGLDCGGDDDLVFPRSAITKKPFHHGALLKFVYDMGRKGEATVHGMRSTFRDWVAERTSVPDHIAEMCLAHTVDDALVRSYKRTDQFERRRKLMAQWASYLSKPAPAVSRKISDKVVSIRARG